jgi:hypothetical protein
LFDHSVLFIQALRIVTEAAEHANCTVKKQDKFDQMLKLQARLGNWELIKPGEKDNRSS